MAAATTPAAGFAAMVCCALAVGSIALPTAAAEPQTLIDGTAHEALFAISADGERAVAVGDAGAILASADGCHSWQAQTAPTQSAALLDVAVRGDDAIAVGQSGIVLRRSTGAQWNRIETATQARLLGVDVNAAGLAIAVGSFGTVLRSDDHGHSWQRLSIDWSQFVRDGFEPHLYAVNVAADGTITVAGEFELILRSNDRGASWSAVHKGEASLFGLAMDDHGRGYAVGQNGRVLRSDDGGTQWQGVAFDGDSILLNVRFDGDRVAVVGIRDLRVSADGGTSWTRVESEDIDTHWYSGISGCGSNDWLVAGHSGRLLHIVDK
jgi:photosystem II stability/assembly factor-like uncharacterized protein